MSNKKDQLFTAGNHIAMKVPPHQFEATLKFYGEDLRLPRIEGSADAGFQFGAIQLWIDRVPGVSQAEMWLQVCTNDTTKAAEYLKENEVQRCDDIEALSEGFDGFWITSPASIVHLVCDESHND